MIQPQNCPKCGAKARGVNLKGSENVVRCANDACTFASAWFTIEDWNSIRYAPSSVPDVQIDEPTPRCTDCGRLMQLVRPGKWQCDPCEAEAEQERKPRRMRSNPSPKRSASHWSEHDETDMCAYFECQPVEPTPADHIADAGKMVVPDPGEGWELCEPHTAESCYDKQASSWTGALWSGAKFYRRRIKKPAAPEWEDIQIESDGRGLHYADMLTGMPVSHSRAVSEPGFMGYRYVYENGETDTLPYPAIQDEDTGEMIFPVAWRKRKSN